MSEDGTEQPPKKNGEVEASADEGQVIRFPLERLKAQRKAKRLAGKLERQKRTTLFLSVVSLFAVMAILNQNNQSQMQQLVQREGLERMVANSELTAEEQALRNQELAEDLADSTKRTPASYGRRPSAIEKLQYETLKGNYRLSYREGYVVEVILDDSGGEKQRAVQIGNSKDFLLRYRDYIAPGYSEVRFVDQGQNGEARSELFDLVDSDGTKVGQAQFFFDLYSGGLIQMNVQEDRTRSSSAVQE